MKDKINFFSKLKLLYIQIKIKNLKNQ